VIKAALKRRCL